MRLLKKQHNAYSISKLTKNHILHSGIYGLKTLNFLRLSESQLLSLIWFLQKKIKKIEKKKKIKLWIRFLPNLVLTKLNSEARMGKGKGSVVELAAFFKPGQVIFELCNLSPKQGSELYRYINQKLSGKIKLTFRPTQF